MSSARLEALKTTASIGYPGEDGGAAELYIYGGGGAVSLPKRPLDSTSSQKTANLLAEWKVFPGTVTEEKKIDSYERPRSVNWAWCVTRRLSNCCIGSAFGKCELKNADGRSLLSITEHCSPWPRHTHHCIRGGVRIFFRGGGVSNNKAFIQQLLV